jgi:hypothetical protein
LGDHLLDLSAILVQAVRQNLCYAWLPPDDVAHLREIIDLHGVAPDQVLDVAEPQGAAEFNLSEGPVDWYSDCVTVDFDPYDVAKSTQLLQDFFVSTGRLRCHESHRMPEAGSQGVVLSMRSGGELAGVAPQPPCSFYALVVEQGNNGSAFDNVLIMAHLRNPCVHVLQAWYPSKVRVQSGSAKEDACMMATAQNVASAAWSTLDAGFTRLNVNLKNLYVPMGSDDGSNYFVESTSPHHFDKWMVREEGMPYAQHVYSFPGYNTSWEDWYHHAASMKSYPQDAIIKRSIAARPI